jgi:large subunit ribosomal protein L35
MRRKLKTKKALAKRVKITKRGKVLFKRSGKSHLLSGKSQKRKRALRRPALLSKTLMHKVRASLPYG